MRKDEKLGKNHVIYILKIWFILLNKKNELIILASTRYAIKGIGKNIVHTALSISTYKAKSLYTNISKIWTY